MDEFVTPPPLDKGDKVAIVRSGNGPGKTEFSEVYELGLERLQDVFGLEPVEFPTTEMDSQELTDNPEKRAEDIMEAFRRDDIKGVIAVIGGEGEQIRILEHLDPEVLRDNPTRFYGYSDNTSLINYLWNLGIVSFYGPMVMTELAMQGEMHDYTVEKCRKAFFSDSIGAVEAAERFTDEDLSWAEPANLDKRREMEESPGLEWYNTSGETVEARIWGGCLEVLDINLGAGKYLPGPDELEGKVLAIETSEEMPDELAITDFMLSIGERGLLEKFSAVVVGIPKARSHRDSRSRDERNKYRENQKQVIKRWMDVYAPNIPVVFNLNFGHTDPIVPLPIGGEIRVDTENREIELK